MTLLSGYKGKNPLRESCIGSNLHKNLDPTKIKNTYWVYEDHPTISVVPSNIGKWMLHYYTNELNKMWRKATVLFRNKKFPGIIQMKCSTGLSNPRAYGSGKMGMIMLYCNKSNEEERITKIGKLIQTLMDYKKPMYYKTDEQTDKGTRATGQKKNSIYKIEEFGIKHCIAKLKSGKRKNKDCGCKARYPKNNPQYCGRHRN